MSFKGGGVKYESSDAYDLPILQGISPVSVSDALSLMIAFATLMIMIDRRDRK